MSAFNLLYLAAHMHGSPLPFSSTPVLAPFSPDHGHLFGFGDQEIKDKLPLVTMLRFSEVFDIDRLAHEVGFGIVEWGELKEGRYGHHNRDIYEDEWADNEERLRLERERPNMKDWPDMVDGEPVTDTLGCWGVSQTLDRRPHGWPTVMPEDYYNISKSPLSLSFPRLCVLPCLSADGICSPRHLQSSSSLRRPARSWTSR